jgi:hypothetical protein
MSSNRMSSYLNAEQSSVKLSHIVWEFSTQDWSFYETYALPVHPHLRLNLSVEVRHFAELVAYK